MSLLSILTPVLPEAAAFLPRAAESVARLRSDLEDGVLEWIVVVDGPGSPVGLDHADDVIQLPRRTGVATARTIALAAASGTWVFPLDADDELESDGVRRLLNASVTSGVGWVSGNRLLMNGRRTAHWTSKERHWPAGTLAEAWTAPFAFHPNSVMARRDVASQVGGWPALPANEDLAWALAMSESQSGVSTNHVVTRYRVWDGQAVSAETYAAEKLMSFDAIESLLNARREALGRRRVERPEPGGAHGVVAIPS